MDIGLLSNNCTSVCYVTGTLVLESTVVLWLGNKTVLDIVVEDVTDSLTKSQLLVVNNSLIVPFHEKQVL